MTKRRIVTGPPVGAIALRSAVQANSATRIGTALVVYMRIVAAIWLGEGLLQWAGLVAPVAGGGGSSGRPATALLEILPLPAEIAAVFFAVIDLVAAVGLWLAAPWGGVVWLVAAGAQFFVLIDLPQFYDYPIVVGGIGTVLVLGYLVLTWLVARSRAGRP